MAYQMSTSKPNYALMDFTASEAQYPALHPIRPAVLVQQATIAFQELLSLSLVLQADIVLAQAEAS